MSTNFKHYNRNLGAIGEPPSQFRRKHQAKRAWKPIRFTHAGLATHALGMDGDEEEAADDGPNRQEEREGSVQEEEDDLFIPIPSNGAPRHAFDFFSGRDPLPDERDSTNIAPSYGDGMMQTQHGQFNPYFLGYSLTLVERIDACKHASQKFWDKMIIYPRDEEYARDYMERFLDMQGQISKDRLSMLRGLVSDAREKDLSKTQHDPKKIEPVQIHDEWGEYDKRWSSVSYQQFVGAANQETGVLDDLMVSHPMMAWKSEIPSNICQDLFNAKGTPNSVELIQTLLQNLILSSKGVDDDKLKQLGIELSYFTDQPVWNFRQTVPSSGLSMPAWSYPRDSKVSTGIWVGAGAIKDHYMEIIVGGVSLSIFKKFYNPRVVQCINLHVLDVAIKWLLSGKSGGMVTFTTLTVKIRRNQHIHTLTIQPMHTPDSCLVSHISFSQRVDLDSNTNVGIIVIPNDMAAITPAQREEIMTFENTPYLLCGAYKGVKLSEEKITQLHANGCILALDAHDQIWDPEENNLDYGFPAPQNTEIRHDKLPKGKVVRISKGVWDVMASSHLTSADTMKTVISIVLYPPFGTHIKPRKSYASALLTHNHADNNDPTHFPVPAHRGPGGYSHAAPASAGRTEPVNQPEKTHVNLKPKFYIRALINGFNDKTTHLVCARWRMFASKEQKNEILAEFFGYFEEVKGTVSKYIRSILNGDKGTGRQQDLEKLLDAKTQQGSFFKFLRDEDVQNQYIMEWSKCIRAFLGRYESDELASLPLVFTTNPRGDMGKFLDDIFRRDQNADVQEAYEALVDGSEEFQSDPNESDEENAQENHGGSMIHRGSGSGGGRGGGGGGRGRGGYRGG